MTGGQSGFEFGHQKGTGRYRIFLSAHRSGLRGASNAMISRNTTFAVRYLAGVDAKGARGFFSLITSPQGLQPNVSRVFAVNVNAFTLVCGKRNERPRTTAPSAQTRDATRYPERNGEPNTVVSDETRDNRSVTESERIHVDRRIAPCPHWDCARTARAHTAQRRGVCVK